MAMSIDAAQAVVGLRRFRVLRPLGEGGMGAVFEAEDRLQQARVALKVLSSAEPLALLSLKNEFKALHDLNHPNLVHLQELLCEDGQWFVSMELVEGVDFLRYVEAELAPVGPSVEAATAQLAPDAAGPEIGPAVLAAAAQGVACRLDRLRDGLAQLTRGLEELHGAGIVHRDVKGSNILVTDEGRVVLVDFGLAVATDWRGWDARGGAGTLDYMAPEQLAGDRVGPAADWYAVGVLTYRALTGRYPFDGPAADVALAKQQREPLAPSRRVRGVPPAWDALCTRLLRFDPDQRASGADVLAMTGIQQPAGHSPHSAFGGTGFVGRKAELARMRLAFSELQSGSSRSLLVCGESGVGKSALVHQCCTALRLSHDDVVILRGRCYLEKTVPYAAVDGVVDELSGLLAGLPPDELRALLPEHAALLGQSFPVLRRLPPIAQASLMRTQGLDPQEQRSRVFAVLRELLQRLAELRRVVVWIDDLQWADPDGLLLLSTVLRRPDAPRLLLFGTVRTGERLAPPELQARLGEGVEVLDLAPLSDLDSHELALLALKDVDGTGSVEDLVREAGGHPMFLRELCRYAGSRADPGVATRLDEALWWRVSQLGTHARALLECLAMAGGPLSIRTAGQTTGLQLEQVGRESALLRVASLVNRSGPRAEDQLEPYHDRIREAVLQHLESSQRTAWHGRIALALEATGEGATQPEALARHWEGAGDLEKAAHHLERAGQAAETALAFEEASRLYARAIALGQQLGSVALALRLRLAAALANAGRGGDAGAAYVAAAEHESGTEALRLRRLAADQFLRNGLIDRGIALLAEVLPAVGVSLPQTRFATISALLWARARLRLRGLGYRERGADEISPRNLERLDVCQTAGNSLSAHDTVLGAVFGARTLLWALEAGEPGRVARGLVLEAGYSASAGPSGARRSEELLAEARRLVERLDEPYLHLYLAGTKGVCDFLLASWREAVEGLDRAMAYGRDRCTGVHWELGFAETMAQTSLYFLGELVALSTRVRESLHEARSRGDVFLATNMRIGLPAVASLAADDPGQTERRVDRAIRSWSRAGFHAEHFWALVSKVEVALYQREGKRALSLVRESWRALSHSLLLRVQIFRVSAHHLRACALLCAAEELGPAEARPLVREATTFGRKLGGERTAYASGLGALVLAGAQSLAGELGAARAHLQVAIGELDRAELGMFAAAARHFLAPLVGGEEGTALHAEATAVAIRQGVVAPHRFFGMLAPGFRGGAPGAR